ncbi:MAG: hypothetical protein ACTSRP_20245 [Candidatus Helarchaeota archaeon]
MRFYIFSKKIEEKQILFINIKIILKFINYLNSAYKYYFKRNNYPTILISPKEFLKIIESGREYQKRIETLIKEDPDFDIKIFIIHQLKQSIDELDIIDFKFYLKPVDKIARTISVFCN